MSRVRKLYEKVARNPKNVRFEEIDLLLRSAGFVVRQPRGGSSHYFYKKGPKIITIPRRQPFVGTVYVKEVLELLKEEIPGE